MTTLDLTEYTEPLSRTPNLLRSVIEGVPGNWLDRRHAPDVVSPREAVSHLLLCDAEESWIDRIQRLRNPDYVFTPGPYAEFSDARLATARPIHELLDEFAEVRKNSLADLAGLNLTEADLAKSRTSEFGTQTVAHLLATWVAHDLYHIGQIFKSYSAPYIDQIGPYQKYLNLPHFN